MRDDEPIEELPQALVERLKAADEPVPMITARVDREVTAIARTHFAGRRPHRAWRSAWTAAAASVLLAVLVLQWPLQAPRPQDDLYADVDGSGRIDIADVLALARSQPRDERSRAKLEAFAYRIVSLDPEEDAS